jgi:hypothetical protein
LPVNASKTICESSKTICESRKRVSGVGHFLLLKPTVLFPASPVRALYLFLHLFVTEFRLFGLELRQLVAFLFVLALRLFGRACRKFRASEACRGAVLGEQGFVE